MLQNGGVFAATTLIFLGLYLYERYGRAQDRKAYDAALEKAQTEHIATLKLVTPLAQKFTDTMDVILPLAMAQINGRRRGE
ncbi:MULTISPECIES: hypothetical protein [Rhizobium]|uniref:hypothetical protein n=2 Tax=Rhizobium TaxID=379 RepID=UPI0001903D67|nr:hypothetical protein [Rhizobium phaseoli]ARM12150.1 hypothetical protein Bra5_CH01913 [Rhizobium phaseoli Brasil 5]